MIYKYDAMIQELRSGQVRQMNPGHDHKLTERCQQLKHKRNQFSPVM